MNKRIRELILKAGFPKFDKMYVVSDGEELEKFAELIVLECIDKITTYDLVPGHSAKWEDIYEIHARLLQDLGEELKEHFGVEEVLAHSEQEETTVPLDDPSFSLFQMERNYPPECTTEAEKKAFAFGWWKAMEELKNKESNDKYSDIVSDGGMDPR